MVLVMGLVVPMRSTVEAKGSAVGAGAGAEPVKRVTSVLYMLQEATNLSQRACRHAGEGDEAWRQGVQSRLGKCYTHPA